MIWLNGDPVEGQDGAPIPALLDLLGVEPERRGVAVAVDDEVVPRAQWAATTVVPGARVEVLTAMQGG